MCIRKTRVISSCLSILAILASLALMPACSVSVKDHGDNGKNKVDINTPVGGIHVDENADVRDTGLPLYPGARPKPKTNDGDKKNANVNISTFGFGLKVVALEYESDDPPAKVIAYYRDQLKRYGNVLQCHSGSSKADDAPVAGSKKGDAGGKLKCDSDDDGDKVELKAGSDDNQHIVSVNPKAKGSDFAIVWVRVHDKEGDI
jgi:hypothetical protein